jgi:integrase
MGRKTYANKKLRAYTPEEIKKMLDVADPKMRAVILLLASTGMRRRGLTDLKWSDMEYLPDEKLYKITVYPGAEEEYTTFTTPEAAEAINKVRDGKSKHFHNIKPQLLSDDIRYLQIKAGIAQRQHNVRQGQYRNETPAIHGFRKFTITEMKRADVDEEVAKMLTDHTPQVGVRVRYLNLDWKADLLPEYRKAISRLTFSQDKIDLIEIKDKEIADLRQQIQDLTQALYKKGILDKD